jgi:hypothetical protein
MAMVTRSKAKNVTIAMKLSDNAALALSMFIERLRIRGQEQIADEIEHFVSEAAEEIKADKKKKA